MERGRWDGNGRCFDRSTPKKTDAESSIYQQGPRAYGDKEINATYGELLWATGEVQTKFYNVSSLFLSFRVSKSSSSFIHK